MPRFSMRASTGTSGRSRVSYTVVTCSAGIRGFSVRHSRSVTSASSAAYSGRGLGARRNRTALAISRSPQPARTGWSCGRAASRTGRPCRGRAAAFEDVGDQHGVVERRDADAAPREDQPVVLAVLADLQDSRVFQQRLHRGERGFSGSWTGAELRIGREQAAGAPGAIGAMAHRHIAGLVVPMAREKPQKYARMGRGRRSRSRIRPRPRRSPGRRRHRAVERAHGLGCGGVDLLSRVWAARASARVMGVKAAGSALSLPPPLAGRVGVGARIDRPLPPRLRPSGSGGRPPPLAGEVKPATAAAGS